MFTEPFTITEEVINRDIKKGLPFCWTMSKSEALRSILAKRGYTHEEHNKGWMLICQLMSRRRPWIPESDLVATPQAQAMAELDALDNKYFAYVRACVEPRYPAQAGYIFENLNFGTGPEALVSLKAMVERTQTLRDGTDPHREETREADQAAVLLMEDRNVAGPEIEARLLALIEQAMEVPILEQDQAAVAEDNLLMERVRKGDRLALDQLVLLHQDWAYTYAANFLKDTDAGRDVVQESFIRAYTHAESYNQGSRFRDWFFTIVKNCCRSRLEQAGVRKQYERQSGERPVERAVTPEVALQRKELAGLLQEALEQLPDKIRSAVIQRDVLEYTYEEMSRESGSSIGTLGKRVTRGHRIMRRYFQEKYGLSFHDLLAES